MFTHYLLVSNLYDFLLFVKHKRKYLEKKKGWNAVAIDFQRTCFSTMEVNGTGFQLSSKIYFGFNRRKTLLKV